MNSKTSDPNGRLNELCDHLMNLDSNAVCLLPTCNQYDVLNTAMLSLLPGKEIHLIAQDATNCAPYLKKKVYEILDKDDGTSRTAGIAKSITIKIGAQIMIRRNIDITLGLVNGTSAKVISVDRETDEEVEKLSVLLPTGKEHVIERMSVKFELMNGVYVVGKQYPICLRYGMTIHKSQGLSLQCAIIEAGNSIFTYGQIYVALSRVTTLEGLHLINYDSSSVKAQESAIMEYNRLRTEYQKNPVTIPISEKHPFKIVDRLWAVHKSISDCQNTVENNDTREWNVIE